MKTMLAVILLAAAALGGATSALAACGIWSVDTTPNAGTSYNELRAVAVASPTAVWAVGAKLNTGVTPHAVQTLIEMWNGTAWRVVASPNAGTSLDSLAAVSADSPTDVWAVGNSVSAAGVSQTLIEHWNGTSWATVPGSNVGTLDNYLFGVRAFSASDAWAVGAYETSGGYAQTLTEHWDGTTWSVVSSPSAGKSDSYLYGISGDSDSDLWAVGAFAAANGTYKVLTERFNGTSWTMVSSPNPGTLGNGLNAVAVLSPTNAWAAGYTASSDANSNPIVKTLVLHYNGTSWSRIASPNTGGGANYLSGLAAVSATSVYAVGSSQNATQTEQTLIEHYNGTAWSVVTSSNSGTGDNVLSGIAADAGTGEVWASGYKVTASGISQTLGESFC